MQHKHGVRHTDSEFSSVSDKVNGTTFEHCASELVPVPLYEHSIVPELVASLLPSHSCGPQLLYSAPGKEVLTRYIIQAWNAVKQHIIIVRVCMLQIEILIARLCFISKSSGVNLTHGLFTHCTHLLAVATETNYGTSNLSSCCQPN